MSGQGVRLIAGSDAGAIPNLRHHRLADGIVVMARCAGLSHAQALRTATSEAAAALGLSATCGRLAEGMCADVLVVDGNPIADLETLCAPLLAVVCRGQEVAPCAGGAERGSAARTMPSWTWARGRDERSAAAGGLGSSGRCPCMREA